MQSTRKPHICGVTHEITISTEAVPQRYRMTLTRAIQQLLGQPGVSEPEDNSRKIRVGDRVVVLVDSSVELDEVSLTAMLAKYMQDPSSVPEMQIIHHDEYETDAFTGQSLFDEIPRILMFGTALPNEDYNLRRILQQSGYSWRDEQEAKSRSRPPK